MNPDPGRHNSNTVRAHRRALRATNEGGGRRAGKSTIVVGVLLVAIQFGVMGLARAVDIPQTADLYLQTSGPSAGLNIGDVYTTPVAQGGDGTDHVYQLTVPSGWPSGTPVTVALYDPESFEDGTATTPSAIDEVRGGDADQTTFELRSPSGAVLQTTTFTTSATNGQWYELLTFDPAVTGYGNYALHVTTGDGNTGPTTENDDDNSWRLRFVSDPDCVAGDTGVCTSAELSNGNETDNVDGLAGTGDELAAGIERGSFQHAGSSSVCNTYYFYVGPTTPRSGPTGGILAHNFDMDNSGSVTYTDPFGGTYAGTVSGNAVWNGSATSTRVGDELPAIEGWWSAEVCLSANNQYVFEGPSGSWAYLDARPQDPQLDLAKDDGGVTEVARGDTITYTIQFSNPSDLSASPGQAVYVSITDAIPTGTSYVAASCAIAAPFTGSCSLDGATGVLTFALAEPVNPGVTGSVSFAVTVDGDAAAPISNTAQATFGDSVGNVYGSTSNTDTNALVAEPVLTVVKSADLDPATVGDTVTYTYAVSHDLVAGDGSDVSGVTVVDSRALTLSGPTGDDGDGVLESGETWTYTATESVTLATPDPLTNGVTVDGTDLDGDPIPQATASASVDIDWEPVLSVTKVGSPDPAVVGDTVTYTYTVTHDASSDGSAVSGVSVVDSRGLVLTGPAGDDGDGLLESGETWTYSASESVGLSTPDPLTNTVTVDGFDRDADPIPQASGSESVDVDWQPELAIAKTGPASALAGSSVSYDVTVSHAGTSDASPISNVVVSDPFGTVTFTGGDTNTNGVLDFGESWTYTVVGTLPVSPDPYTNTASVQGTDLDGEVAGPVTDDHVLDVIQPATISNLAFTDVDGDGVYTSGTDTPLAGVVVNLYDATGTTLLGSQTTAADGLYSFGGLAPDTYIVEFVGPAGHVLTAANQGADDTVDSDATPAGAAVGSVSVTVVDGETNDTIDAGFYVPVSIGDFVFFDVDADGVFSAGVDVPLEGVTVTLVGTDGTGNPVSLSTTTDATGAYAFDGLAPGTYTVSVTAPAGMTATVDRDATADGTTDVIATSGSDVTDADFGFTGAGTIGDQVFEDVDADGVFTAGTDVPLAGVSMSATWAGVDGTLGTSDDIVLTTVSAVDGTYAFTNLPAGLFSVDADETTTGLAAPVATTSDPAVVSLVAAETNLTVDFGYYVAGSISDFVWHDLDGDGVQDAGEPGIEGVTVTLTAPGADGVLGTADDTTTTATTDAAGAYAFGGLVPGDHRVTFDLSTNTAGLGYVFTPADQGGDDTLDSDADGTGSVVVTVLSGVANDTVDAGAYVPVTISDFVWVDGNGNGVQDAGEPGLDGVTVELLDGTGTVVGSTLTAGGGLYSFAGLAPGSYEVRVVPPAGYAITAADLGGDDTLDSDADPATGATGLVVYQSGDTTADVDAGLYVPVTIGDLVFEDVNGNEVYDAGIDGPYAGVTVTATYYGPDGILGTADDQVIVTTTDATGAYAINGAPGTYDVVVTMPAGAQPTTATSFSTTLASGASDLTVDAGFYLPMTVGDTVWIDLNGNGVQDAGEPGLAGVAVTLVGTDGLGNTVNLSTTTDATGAYGFANLAPGAYTVTVDGSGWTFTTQDAGADDTVDSDVDALGAVTVTTTSGTDNLTVDAGVLPITIGDYVWVDANGNGVQDAGEGGLSGVTVNLRDAVTDAIVATTLTAADGSYQLAAGPGDYVLEFVAPAGYGFTESNVGADDGADSDASQLDGRTGTISVTDATNSSIIHDAGLYELATISDFVWDDLNGNGVQDAGEPGLDGVTVTLTGTDGAGNPISATTTTAGGGLYQFDVPPGTYTASFDLIGAYVLTAPDQGVDDTLDSDVGVEGATSGAAPAVTVTSGEVNDTIDAGAYVPAAIVGTVLEDDLAEGTQDALDTPLAGVTVNLLDSLGVVIATTTTDAGGNYSFSVAPGTYSVQVVAPVGATFSPQDAAAEAIDSDVDAAGTTAPVTVASGDVVDLDALAWFPAEISDYVWVDLDEDGLQDAGEPGLGGVTVNLLDDLGATVATTTTAADGSYAFSTAPGTYSVAFVLSAGSTFAPADVGADDTIDSDVTITAGNIGQTAQFAVTSSDVQNTIDAGVTPATLGDFVWNDLNGDGIQGSGEPGIEGVTVTVSDGVTTYSAITAANGSWSVSVEPGTWTVTFDVSTNTAGLPYTFTLVDQGADDTVDSDADPATGAVSVVVTSSVGNLTIDAGAYVAGAVSDFVWDDLNGNGIQDAGEPGLAGVVVNLVSDPGPDGLFGTADDVVVATDTTDAAGAYTLSAQPGDYTVVFFAPVDYVFSAPNLGVDDTVDSDALVTADPTVAIAGVSLVSGMTDTSVDAGLFDPVEFGDVVWVDLDGDGIQDAGEPGWSGMVVTLTGTDGAGNAVSLSTTTDALGAYQFVDVAPGSYTVTFDPTGVVFTIADAGADDTLDSDAAADGTVAVTATSGTDDPTIDAGIAPALIGDLVFDDLNGNGVWEAGEAGLAGVEVTLTGTDASGNPVSLSTTTDALGAYSFAVAPGTYSVAVTDPAGTVLTTANDPTGLTVASGELVDTVDFGFYMPATIGNFVWDDLDGNGVQYAGEPGIGGVTVNLFDSADLTTPIATATTAADGTYAFVGLAPGEYVVGFVAPVGAAETLATQGADPSVDSDVVGGLAAPVTVVSGETNTTVDAGYVFPATVGDLVFEDVDGDGVFTSGVDVPLTGVTVTLVSDPGPDGVFGTADDVVADTAVTDAAGAYTLTAAAPGTYTVVVDETTTGLAPATSSTGNEPLTLTLASGESVTTADFGYFQPATIGDLVFEDVDADGVYTAGVDQPIAGATVNLIGTDGFGNPVALTATTDAAGFYEFTVDPGSYTVDVDETTLGLATPTLSTANEPLAIGVVSADAVTTADFGYFTPGFVVGTVLDDAQADGIQDAADVAISGVTVELWEDTTGDGIADTFVATTTTDAGGNYSFAVPPGDYQVVVDTTGYLVSPTDATVDTADSDIDATGATAVVPVASGATTDLDALLYTQATLGDTVWNDLDANGLQDAGEPGVPGVTVDLWQDTTNDGFFDTLVGTTTTDAAGVYSFTVDPGVYQAVVTAPAGSSFTLQDQGADNTVDSDVAGGGLSNPVVLTSGELYNDLDAGLVFEATIADFVWDDVNGNGIQDAGEPGVAGVTVNLTGTDYTGAAVSSTTTTDALGAYSFVVAPGTYTVEFVAPVGSVLTAANQGADDAVDSDADPATGLAAVTVGSGEVNDTVDAGLYVPAVIGDFVWDDLNGNGVQDAGEPGLVGVTVNLTGTDGAGNAVSLTTTTDASGLYAFAVAPGTYAVEVVAPVGDVFSAADQGGDDALDSDVDPVTGVASAVTVVSGDTNNTIDAGLYTPVTIAGSFLEDAGAEGTQDAADVAISGATVNLWADTNADGIPDTIVATTTTDVNGDYSFTAPPGTYAVEFVAPAGASFSPQDAAADTIDSDADAAGLTAPVTLASGATADLDALAWYPAEISDFVWNDLDLDGIQDAGEPGLSGVTVNLTGTDGAGNPVSLTTTTDAGGLYGFDVMPGTYTVEFVLPANTVFSAADQGADDTIDSDADPATGLAPAVTVTSGEVNATVDAGLQPAPATIGNFVWDDVNGDGIQDAGEPGIAGATVELLDAGGAVVATTTTDGLGAYSFTAQPGTYSVRVTAAGYTPTAADQGTDDALDSDIGATGESAQFTVVAAEVNDTVDAGLYVPAVIGDFVWDDLNGNGVQDAGEPGLVGVTVNLTGTDGAGNAVSLTTTTDASGLYAFAVAPGTYTVEVVAPVGDVFSSADQGGDDALDSDVDPATGSAPAVTAVSGETNNTIDAALYTPATMTGTIWDDANGNGIQDAGEPGVPGVTVQLLDDLGAVTGTTTTDAAGTYTFAGLAPGTYQVAVVVPAADVLSPLDQGADDAVDSDFDQTLATSPLVTLTSGETNDTIDGGLITTITIGDQIFNDLNADGTEDAGEPGLGGVTVTLTGTDTLGNPVSATTVTDAGGFYEFTGLLPGDYTIDVDDATLPPGATLTTANDPTNLVGLRSGDSIVDVDFGYDVPAAVAITKTALTPTILSGETATFEITVSNVGSTDLGALTVSDPLAPNCDTSIAGLSVGASTTYTCSLTNVTADFVNEATVTGADVFGTPVSDAATAPVDVINPAISVSKTPNLQQVVSGGVATFTITVQNIGDADLTNVTVSDVVAPACDSFIGNLASGAMVSYSCTLSGQTVDYTNTATVTADAAVGPQLTASDTADVDVINPSFTVSKTPDTQYVRSGETASFTVDVTNTGDVDLTVTVADANAPGCDFGPGIVAAGVTQTITCTVTSVTADFTNTAVVDALDPNGDPLAQQSDVADVIVINPAITIDKTPSVQTMLAGQDAVFTIRVTNTGDSLLTNIVVSDPQAPTCDRTFASIGPGLFSEYTCTVTGVTASFTNVASVVADDLSGQAVSATSGNADVVVEVPVVDIQKTPNLQQVQVGDTVTFTIVVTNGGAVDLHNVVVSDPLAPDCDRTFPVIAVGANETYTCTLTNVTEDFTNTASVTATDAVGNAAAPDSDVADVDAITPSVAITKTADTPTVFLNGTAQFTIEVTNTGDVDLTNVTVADPLAPACDTIIATLLVGASQSYTCSVGPVTADFTNEATVTATPPAGADVTDSATAPVTVLFPGIDVQKTPDYQIVGAGGTVDFTITVTNTGATDLSNVVISDALAPVCDAGPLSLLVGESTSYTCTSDPVSADFTNQVDVSAEDPAGNVVSASDTADVDLVNPTLTVTKSPALQTLLSGETASFSILVENTGDIDLQNVVVTDLLAPGCDSVIGTLAAGTSQTITCDVVDVTADFTNMVDVTADDPLGGPALTASDTADVDVVFPGVDLQKTPDSQQVVTGADATFTITITNTGDQDLVDLVVTDAVAPDCDATIAGPLAPGASTSYTCTMTVTGDVTNVAAVTGEDINGNPVSFSDDAFVDAINPSLSISKTPDSQTVVLNGQAEFTVAVTNTGDVPLSNVDVIDPLAPDCDRLDLTLAIGETRSWTCSLAPVAADFTNTVTASADDPNGDPVAPSAADTADVTVLVPAVDIAKSPNLQQVQVGDDATFTILVTNRGETDLFDVVVSDPLVPACDATFSTIPVGGSETYSCTVTVAADFTNTITADATDPLGNAVPQASDVADVDAVVPAISIAKTPDIQTVPLGDSVTFTIEVTNTGDTDLSGVIVSDALVPACDTTTASLPIGATQSYSCTSAFGVMADFTNTAVVTATPPVGADVSASDTADVTVLLPGVTVDKSPATQVIGVGDDATFTIRVTNSGQVDLVNVVVTDSVTPSCSTTFAGPVLPGDFVEHTCAATNVTGPFTNTVDVAAEDANGNSVTDSATADVTIDPPALSVVKDPATQDVPLGGTATFAITVTNTSLSDLVDVTVSDPLAPACDTVIPLLPGTDQTPANSVTVICSEPGATADYTNTVSVTATDLAGGAVGPVSDAADVNVLGPAITVTKDPASQLVGFGQDATFTIAVANTGEIALQNVVVTDLAEPTCDRVFATLAVGEVQSWTCTTSGVVADFTNTVDVVADDGAGNLATATASADVVVEPVGDLSGFVFVDADGDGVFDSAAGDTPLAFVDVVLTDPVGNPIVVTTDAAGTWTLVNTPIGDYTVDVDETDPDFPAGYYETTATDGQTVTVSDGGAAVAADTGYAPPATISGAVFEDLTGDGVSTSDPALVGTTVNLYEDTTGDGLGDTLLATTPVAADGTYTFSGLPAGDYVVEVVLPAGYDLTVQDLGTDDTIDSDVDPTSGRTDVVIVAPAQVVADVDAGAYLPIEIGGTVFNDLAGDGIADATDPPLAGVDVIITGAGPDGVSGTADDTILTVTTALDGTYHAVLPPGDYSVEVVEPAGTTVTTANDPTALTLASGDAPASVDFGIEAPGTVSGTVVLDADGDGIGSGEEPLLGGITVTATNAGPDGVLGTADDTVVTTTTDANGDYVFVGLAPGDHVIAIDLATVPPGTSPSFDPDPTADGTTTVTLAAGETITDVSFGLAGTGSLTQVVFHDVDGNGLLDSGEPVFVGVTATATWAGQDGLLGTGDDVEFSGVTDATGTAFIPFLPAGDYEIRIDTSDLPAGLVASADPDGTADSTTLVSIAVAEALDVGAFGYTGTGTIGDLVFFDYDQDGTADPGEPGAAGVGVIATWPGPDGVFGTADDVVYTTTTAADGSYLFTNLPAGDIRVELDPATLPAGSGGAVPVVVTLAPGGTNLDVDFGLGANLPPTAQDDSATTLEDTAVTIAVLGNDSDPEGHGLEVVSVTQPANGTVTINPDGTVTYVPDTEFSGADTFTYTVCEDVDAPMGGPIAPEGLCDTATVTVAVDPVNDAPVLRSPTTITVVVGQPMPPLDFSDPEGSPVTVVLAAGVLPPGVTLNADGTFSGTPTTPGVYTVTIEACDPDGACAVVVFSFVVQSNGTTGDPALPFTGNDSQTQAAGALALIVAGAALVLVARRRGDVVPPLQPPWASAPNGVVRIVTAPPRGPSGLRRSSGGPTRMPR